MARFIIFISLIVLFLMLEVSIEHLEYLFKSIQIHCEVEEAEIDCWKTLFYKLIIIVWLLLYLNKNKR